MSAPTQTTGTRIDGGPRASSQSLSISAGKLVTLQDLLAELQHDKQIAMLRTTAGHITAFLKAPVEKVRLDALINIVPEFRVYLNQRRYKPNATNSYCNYAGVLLRRAKELGWVPTKLEIPGEWEEIAAAVRRLKGAHGIITSISSALIRNPASGEKPTVFTCADDKAARSTVIALAKEIGFEGVDASHVHAQLLLVECRACRGVDPTCD